MLAGPGRRWRCVPLRRLSTSNNTQISGMKRPCDNSGLCLHCPKDSRRARCPGRRAKRCSRIRGILRRSLRHGAGRNSWTVLMEGWGHHWTEAVAVVAAGRRSTWRSQNAWIRSSDRAGSKGMISFCLTPDFNRKGCIGGQKNRPAPAEPPAEPNTPNCLFRQNYRWWRASRTRIADDCRSAAAGGQDIVLVHGICEHEAHTPCRAR